MQRFIKTIETASLICALIALGLATVAIADVCGILRDDGRITDIANRPPAPGDTRLVAMPDGFGPFTVCAGDCPDKVCSVSVRHAIPHAAQIAERDAEVALEACLSAVTARRAAEDWKVELIAAGISVPKAVEDRIASAKAKVSANVEKAR